MPNRVDSAWLRFWGVRGSIPTPGPGTVYYGGNTSCVEVRDGENIIILDAGSGLRLLGQDLTKEHGSTPMDLTLLLTHTHWDHIQGLPFFSPVYQPQNKIRIIGQREARQGLASVLSSQMESPFFPIGLKEVPANVRVEELSKDKFQIGRTRIEVCPALHPGGCVGYRLTATSGKSVAFFPDNEVCGESSEFFQAYRQTPRVKKFSGKNGSALRNLIEFVRGADVLIMDSQYDHAEYGSHIGWGHGCVDDVVALAVEANVGNLFLFHHDPDHDDAKISKMLRHGQALVKKTKSKLKVAAAREGIKVSLGN
jgi:phosphoribosyl 1,2-cyclic phosphodiesterase